MFAEVERRSVSDSVFEQLKEGILSGEMAAGSKLPAERELCAMMGVNRGAVREALKRLEQAQLVRIQHGGGTHVLDYRKSGGLDLLGDMLVAQGGRINVQAVQSLMEMRTCIGTDVVRLAALRADDMAVREARSIVVEMEELRDDLERLQELALTYWDVLVDSSENIAYRLAFNTMEQTYDKVRDAMAIVMEEELTAFETYHQILDAIHRRDTEVATQKAQYVLEIGAKCIVDTTTVLAQMALMP